MDIDSCVDNDGHRDLICMVMNMVMEVSFILSNVQMIWCINW